MPIIWKDKVTHAGCVLDEYEKNGYNDSDFFAIVWNDVEQKVEEIQYASTRYYSYDHSCVIDATPEVKAKADAWGKARSYRQRVYEHTQFCETAFVAGRKVRVVKGRKYPKGTEGEILSIHKRSFGITYNFPNEVVNAYVDTGKDRVYINVDNLVLIDIDERKELVSEIKEVEDNRNWRSRYLLP